MSKYTDQLGKAYPNGPGHGVAWVSACIDLMRGLGLDEATLCVVGAYIGGVPESRGWFEKGDTIKSQCKAYADGSWIGSGLPSVPDALGKVRAVDADLAAYLQTQGAGWQAKQEANRARNESQDLQRLLTHPFDYLAWAFPDSKGLWDGLGKVVIIAGVVVVVGGGAVWWASRRAS